MWELIGFPFAEMQKLKFLVAKLKVLIPLATISVTILSPAELFWHFAPD